LREEGAIPGYAFAARIIGVAKSDGGRVHDRLKPSPGFKQMELRVLLLCDVLHNPGHETTACVISSVPTGRPNPAYLTVNPAYSTLEIPAAFIFYSGLKTAIDSLSVLGQRLLQEGLVAPCWKQRLIPAPLLDHSAHSSDSANHYRPPVKPDNSAVFSDVVMPGPIGGDQLASILKAKESQSSYRLRLLSPGGFPPPTCRVGAHAIYRPSRCEDARRTGRFRRVTT
jgi:hypothetical protein